MKGSEAEDYVDRLLVLPQFLIDPTAPVTPAGIGEGLLLTGHFLERRLYALINKPPPEERDRMIARLERTGAVLMETTSSDRSGSRLRFNYHFRKVCKPLMKASN